MESLDAAQLATQQLEQDIKMLIKQAKESGFTDEDIDECIAEVVNDGANTYRIKSFCSRFIWRSFLLFYKVIVVIICFIVLLTIVFNYAPRKVILRIEQPFAPHVYKVQRYIRYLTLPIHDYINLTDYYTSSCLINNPFFKESGPEAETLPECVGCADLILPVPQVDMNNISAERAFVDNGIVVYLSYLDAVEPTDFVKFYEDKEGSANIKIDGKLYNNVADVIDFHVNTTSNPDFRAAWSSSLEDMEPLVIRQPFIPQFVERTSEVNFYALGPMGRQFSLPDLGSNSLRVVTQLSGRCDLVIEPHNTNCVSDCGFHRIILNAGHSVQYYPSIWRGVVKSNSTSDLSLIYTVDFEWDRSSINDAFPAEAGNDEIGDENDVDAEKHVEDAESVVEDEHDTGSDGNPPKHKEL